MVAGFMRVRGTICYVMSSVSTQIHQLVLRLPSRPRRPLVEWVLVVGPYLDGKKVVVVLGVSVGDPDATINRECRKAYGSAYEAIAPYEDPDAYESAYELVAKSLGRGEAMTILDRNHGRVSFFTPNRMERAWSAWIRVVDVSRFHLN